MISTGLMNIQTALPSGPSSPLVHNLGSKIYGGFFNAYVFESTDFCKQPSVFCCQLLAFFPGNKMRLSRGLDLITFVAKNYARDICIGNFLSIFNPEVFQAFESFF
jgi:hypothetical protein